MKSGRRKGVSPGQPTKHDEKLCGRRNVENMEKVSYRGRYCNYMYNFTGKKKQNNFVYDTVYARTLYMYTYLHIMICYNQ